MEIKAHLAVSHNGTPLGILNLEAETATLFQNRRDQSPRNAAAHPRKRLETSTGPLRKPKNSHNCIWLEHRRSAFIWHWTTPVIVGWVTGARGKITISGIPNRRHYCLLFSFSFFFFFGMHGIYKCGGRLHNTDWRSSGWRSTGQSNATVR